MKTSRFERYSKHNIRLHVMPTDQFKTYAISVYIGSPLTEQTVTSTALIPFVLRRGTGKYPETKQFRERLDDLYGAGFGFDIYKRGDYQIAQFRMDIIHDQFVSDSTPLLQQAFEYIGECLTNPAKENGHFTQKYVAAETTTLRKRIESIINDKIRYAAERCIEEMCRNEPYRLLPLGRIEALQEITAENLYSSYQDWLSTAAIDIYVVGNTTLEEVKSHVEAAFQLERSDVSEYENNVSPPSSGDVRTVIEKLEVKQGKLNMGLRTAINYADDAYAAGLMYNGILGGYPHSKLFINVREKASLAYYASSRLDGHKGIMTIQSGIEMINYEKAVDIIRKQLDAMVAGEISDLELSQTRAMISNQLRREIRDSAFEMIGFDFNSVLSGKVREVQTLIESVEAADKAQIQQVAEQVKLDTIYFLRDQEGE